MSDFRTCHNYNRRKIYSRDTMYYQAPEILNQQMYDAKIDVWSACVVLYILLTGDMPCYDHLKSGKQHPFKWTSLLAEQQNVTEKLSRGAKSFLKMGLVTQQKKRATC